MEYQRGGVSGWVVGADWGTGCCLRRRGGGAGSVGHLSREGEAGLRKEHFCDEASSW